jgi:hypothetical protein
MLGPIVIVAGLAGIAGVCAFLIEYEEALHRFPKDPVRLWALRTGAVAASFFATLGVVLIVVLTR